MTSSCCMIMGCRRRTLSDDTVNFKLALLSPSGLSVMRAASLCQQAPCMASDMAIFSKLPCHWQSCSYLANNQAGNQTVLNCRFRTREAAGVSIQQGSENGTALPRHWPIPFFIYPPTCLSGGLLHGESGERGVQRPQKGPNSDSAFLGKWPRPSRPDPTVVSRVCLMSLHLLYSVRCGCGELSRCFPSEHMLSHSAGCIPHAYVIR